MSKFLFSFLYGCQIYGFAVCQFSFDYGFTGAQNIGPYPYIETQNAVPQFKYSYNYVSAGFSSANNPLSRPQFAIAKVSANQNPLSYDFSIHENGQFHQKTVKQSATTLDTVPAFPISPPQGLGFHPGQPPNHPFGPYLQFPQIPASASHNIVPRPASLTQVTPGSLLPLSGSSDGRGYPPINPSGGFILPIPDNSQESIPINGLVPLVGGRHNFQSTPDQLSPVAPYPQGFPLSHIFGVPSRPANLPEPVPRPIIQLAASEISPVRINPGVAHSPNQQQLPLESHISENDQSSERMAISSQQKILPPGEPNLPFHGIPLRYAHQEGRLKLGLVPSSVQNYANGQTYSNELETQGHRVLQPSPAGPLSKERQEALQGTISSSQRQLSPLSLHELPGPPFQPINQSLPHPNVLRTSGFGFPPGRHIAESHGFNRH